jgi:endonuclease-8
MSEGDTIFRIAATMRRTLGDDRIMHARGRLGGGAQLERLVGSRVQRVTPRGKHLLIDFEGGLTLHTHLGMVGSWHRYRPGERWRRPADEAVAVLETARAVAVCFAAPTVELIETRALPRHPVLAELGPDPLDPAFDRAAAVRRMAASRTSVAEALLDQRVVAGVGNVYRNEALAACRLDPFEPACEVGDEGLSELLETAASMLRANVGQGLRATVPGAPAGERWVYRRAGRPCRRCGTIIRSASIGQPPRMLFWCPRCQVSGPRSAA